MKRSNVTDYAALRYLSPIEELYLHRGDKSFQTKQNAYFICLINHDIFLSNMHKNNIVIYFFNVGACWPRGYKT